MSTEEQAVPFGNYQYEIYLKGLGGETPALPIDYDDLEALAAERLSPEAFHYAAGGAGEGRSMTANRRAFDAWQILPRMLGDVSVRDLGTDILGTRFPAPVMLGPVGVLSILHADAELAVARAAAAHGRADVPEHGGLSTMEDVAGELGDTPGWYQLYWPSDPELAESLVRRAERRGLPRHRGHAGHAHDALAPARPERRLPALPARRGHRQLPERPGLPRAPGAAARGRHAGRHRPVGAGVPQPHPGLGRPGAAARVDRPAGAGQGRAAPRRRAPGGRAGRAGRGGVQPRRPPDRRLGHPAGRSCPRWSTRWATRPRCCWTAACARGSDVLKAVALGARAVLVARSYVWGLALGGDAGVEATVRNLLADTDLTLAMAGLSSIAQVDRDLLVAA